MRLIKSLIGGMAGAIVTTYLHQTFKKKFADAPRMDLLGEEALNEGLTEYGYQPLEGDKLHTTTFVGDLIGNAAFYSLAGIGSKKTGVSKGALLGLSAGAGAIFIPQVNSHLSEEHSNKTASTQLMTMAIYLAGGLVAGTVTQLLNKMK